MHMLTKIMPEMPTSNVAAALAYYRDVLGFSVNYWGLRDFRVLDPDDNQITFGQPQW